MSRLVLMLFALILLTPLSLAERSPYVMFASGTLVVKPSVSTSSRVSEVKVFTLAVARTGFNGSSGGINLQVNQGDRIRINFVYGDGDLRQDNPHVVTIDGYNIETGEISKKNPIETVEFTAGQVGKFRLYCSIPCLGMENLQQGMLEVSPPKLGTFIRTSLSARHLEVHHPYIDHSLAHTDLLHVIAYVMDETGSPVAGVLVDFLVSTRFGIVKVASNMTEADGSAHLLYPLAALREMKVTVSFWGSGGYMASNATELFTPVVSVGEIPETPFLSGQNSLVDLRVVGIQPHVGATLMALIALVVGSVWLTYAYVLSQILKIKRVSSKRVKVMVEG